MGTDQEEVIAETETKLRPHLGKLLVHDEVKDLLAVAIPGSPSPVDHAVVIHAQDGPGGPVLGVGSLIATNVDWSTEGLPMFCLRETSCLVFGSVELCDEGMVIGQMVFADTSGEQLVAVVIAIAHAAARIRSDLDRMGALTIPPDEETGAA